MGAEEVERSDAMGPELGLDSFELRDDFGACHRVILTQIRPSNHGVQPAIYIAGARPYVPAHPATPRRLILKAQKIMRAEAEALVLAIKQSMGLLRRHL